MSHAARCPALVVSAAASGQGKTTVTAALARLHERQGRRVRVFKCGPDYLDPYWHQLASGAQVEGRVRMLAPTVDPQTRNALVYVDLPAHSDIRAGMFARGEFLLGAHEALSVPLSAVVVRDGFSYVFEVDAQGRVAMRRVQTGQRSGGRVEITEGLSLEAHIVQQGGAFLNDGDLVRTAAGGSEQKQAPGQSRQAPPATK